MGNKNAAYNAWLKAQKKGYEGTFEEFIGGSFEEGKYVPSETTQEYQLEGNYSTWDAIAQDVYGDPRMAMALMAANPGLDRFYQGDTINLPPAYKNPYVSYDWMAQQMDQASGTPGTYWNGRQPTDAFWTTQPVVKEYMKDPYNADVWRSLPTKYRDMLTTAYGGGAGGAGGAGATTTPAGAGAGATTSIPGVTPGPWAGGFIPDSRTFQDYMSLTGTGVQSPLDDYRLAGQAYLGKTLGELQTAVPNQTILPTLTPEQLQALQAAGMDPVAIQNYIAAQAQGGSIYIPPNAVGNIPTTIPDLTPEQLKALKDMGIQPDAWQQYQTQLQTLQYNPAPVWQDPTYHVGPNLQNLLGTGGYWGAPKQPTAATPAAGAPTNAPLTPEQLQNAFNMMTAGGAGSAGSASPLLQTDTSFGAQSQSVVDNVTQISQKYGLEGMTRDEIFDVMNSQMTSEEWAWMDAYLAIFYSE